MMEQDEATDDSGDETQCTRTDDGRRRSIDSSAAHSVMTTDDEDGNTSKYIDSSAYGSRHKAMEVAIKEKTKRLLSLVRMDSVLVPGKGRWRDRRASKVKSGEQRVSLDIDEPNRRPSVSTLVSIKDESRPIPIQQNLSPPQYLDNPVEVFGSSATSSRLTSSPPNTNKGMPRRMSLLKRSMSGRSAQEKEPIENDDIILTQDSREGVYDTSKKQRVPSWVSF
jgi:hypothetical protein